MDIRKTLKGMKAEVEWNYPLEYAAAIEEVIAFLDNSTNKVTRCKDCVWWEAKSPCFGRCQNPTNGLWNTILGDFDYCSFSREKQKEGN